MQRKRLVLFGGLIAVLILTGCSASADAPESGLQAAGTTAGQALPQLSGLDSIPGRAQHGSSALQDIIVDVTAPLKGAHYSPVGGGIEFDSFQHLAYAMYRVAIPEGPLQQCNVTGSGQVWLLGADYGSGTWKVLAALNGLPQQVSLAALSDYASPGGFIYLAAVAYRALPSGGDTDDLSQLALRWDKAVEGPTYFVDMPANGGNDANDGSSAHPWATLQHAADTVVAGDSVIVRVGTYDGFMLQTSGAPGAPITFSAQLGATINKRNTKTPDGINIENWDEQTIHDVVIEGFTVLGIDRAGIRTALSEHITIRNCTCGNNQVWGILSGHSDYCTVADCELYGSVEQHGVYLSNSSDHCIVRGCLIHDNDDCGIHHNGDAEQGGDGVMSDCLIENNVIWGNGFGDGGSGINCDGVQDSIIRNNLLYDNGSSGISLYMIDASEPATGNSVVNNTVVQPGGNARWCLNIQDGSGAGCKVFNNILFNYHSFRGAIDINDASLPGFESDYNIVVSRFVINEGDGLDLADWRSATGQDMHSLALDPADVLVDPLGTSPEDYELALDSPALNAALAAKAPATDLLGTARPQGSGPDIGCYEMP